MITLETAKSLANQHLLSLHQEECEQLTISNIQIEPFGWIFFYQTKEFIETGSISSMLAGNSPFIINNDTGEIYTLGTAYPTDVYIKEYAAQHAKIK